MVDKPFAAVRFPSPPGRGCAETWSRDRRNVEQGPPESGRGIGGTWSRDPLAGCDRGADRGRVGMMPIPCASSGSDPQRGPSSALRRAPKFLFGDLTLKAVEGGGAVPMRLVSGRIPKKILGPLLHLDSRPACGMRPWSRSRARRSNADPMRVSGVRSPEGPLSRPSTRPGFGDATVEAHVSTRSIAALHPAAGSHPSGIRLEPAPPPRAQGEGAQKHRLFPWEERRLVAPHPNPLPAAAGRGAFFETRSCN